MKMMYSKCLCFILALVLMCCFDFGIVSLGEGDGYIDQEILFQDIQWGSSDKQVIDAIYNIGLIKKKMYFDGSGAKPSFFWPEDDSDLRYRSVELLPQVIRDKRGYQGLGLWIRSFTPLKTIGGHTAEYIGLHYASTISRNTISQKYTITDKCDDLIAISIVFTEKTTGESMPEIFGDLLTKLSNQYGKMKIYMCSAIRDKSLQKEVTKVVKSYSPSSKVIKYKEGNMLAYAIIHGAKNTGIVLRWTKADEIELIYAKDNSYLRIQNLKEAVESINSEKKEDVGL